MRHKISIFDHARGIESAILEIQGDETFQHSNTCRKSKVESRKSKVERSAEADFGSETFEKF